MKPEVQKQAVKLVQNNWLLRQVWPVRSGTLLAALGAMMVALVLTSSSRAADQIVLPSMVGHWEGNARIIMTWCQQTNLPITLDIRADNTVAGKVGDATLINGRLRRNRGWLGRKLQVKTDYIITGNLTGPVVAAENITRSGVKMPVNFRLGNFVGGLHTSGSKFGGKRRMILSAGLVLARAPTRHATRDFE
jgi:hypothetical protein